MAYNRIANNVYENHNWCKNCNLATKDKSVMRCSECNNKVRTKPRSYGQRITKKETNLSRKVINTVLDLLEDKRGLTARRIFEITNEKTGVDLFI